jgi:hypothetical protein
MRNWAYFFSGDGDLIGLLFGFLADEPDHLLDLLGDIGVVHFRFDSDPRVFRAAVFWGASSILI